MTDPAHDTIAAVSTPPGPARRGIVRVSGPGSAALVRATVQGELPPFEPGRARLCAHGRFDDGRGLQPVTLLWMRAPRSFTREDVAEFHLPGAEPLLACALARLLALGARAARPGEFTRRAFLNGRLDLSRAEGVLALTEAGNEAARAAAALLLDGGLGERAAAIRERVLALLTLCEASLDFDESETGHVPRAELERELGAAEAAVDEALAWEVRRAAPASAARVLLLGAPNAGKSSLWNALTGGRALVSPEAGTTRDSLAGEWRLATLSCRLIDGPGLEPAPGAGIGVDRSPARPAERAQELFAREREQADLVLWVVDASRPAREAAPAGARVLVWNKTDLPSAGEPPRLPGIPAVAVSARSGAGLVELTHAVERALTGADGEGGATRMLFARHHEALVRARAELGAARELLVAESPLDLTAEALRATLAALDELSGRTLPEDVLERIFARFCLGK
jgi:tRNA modification GTPase